MSATRSVFFVRAHVTSFHSTNCAYVRVTLLRNNALSFTTSVISRPMRVATSPVSASQQSIKLACTQSHLQRNVQFQKGTWARHLPIKQSSTSDATPTLRRHEHERPQWCYVPRHRHCDRHGWVHVGTCAQITYSL
jgi:hypothetical protein